MQTGPKSFDELRRMLQAAPGPSKQAFAAARERDAVLTKPPGALGRLEELASWYCGWRDDARAVVNAPTVLIFAGNHGVAARGVSAFPPEVTRQMVANFETGGAAINQLAREAGAALSVHALDLDRPTADFTQAPAMSEGEAFSAALQGWEAVDPTSDLLVVGEMGIGNTTSAAAISCALFGGEPEQWVGRGTGIDTEALQRKAETVRQALAANPTDRAHGFKVLQTLGGRELAAMAGAIARARVLRIPVILDGFICCAAAACLEREISGALDHSVAGHQSAESAHAMLLENLGKAPILDLGMRLGEASGAALAINILKAALACHSNMATFDEAGVAKG